MMQKMLAVGSRPFFPDRPADLHCIAIIRR
jgi:hypothetical protein